MTIMTHNSATGLCRIYIARMRTTKPVMLTISIAAIEAARAAAACEGRSLSNYTSVLYELAGHVRLADIERLAAAQPAVVEIAQRRRAVGAPARAEAR